MKRLLPVPKARPDEPRQNESFGLAFGRGYLRIVFLFTCLFSYPVFAQQQKTLPVLHVIDSLKNSLKNQNDDTNKINALNNLSREYRILDNDSALSYAKSAQSLAQKIKFKEGIADAFINIGVIYFRQYNYQKALEYYFKSFTIYQYLGNKKNISNVLNNIGLVYYNLGNFSNALEYDFKVLTIAQKIKDTNAIATVFCNIGIIYEGQGTYSEGLEYLFKSLEIHRREGNKDAIAINLGNIGWGYLAQGNYPKALEYDFKAVTLVQEVGDKIVTANFLGDIGTIYYKQGNNTLALEYDFKAVTIAREIGDIDDIANVYSTTGEVYTKLKNYKRAKTFLDSALTFSEKIGDKKYIENTYSNLAILDSAIGNYKTAYGDYKKYTAYRDSIINQGTTQMEISYEFEKKEDSIRLEEDSIRIEYEKENIIKTSEIKRKKNLNDSIIVILTLTILLAISVINREKIKRKKEKIIFEKEKQQMENELSTAKAILDDYIKNMVEKNILLEQFKTEMEKLKNLKSKELEDIRVEQLEHLNKTTILTNEDWDKFQELFEQVYKGFFIRLKENLPNLTQAEIRLICLTKLNLTTKQIGAILGISLVTVKKARYRLRKKLNLSGKDGLNRVADSI